VSVFGYVFVKMNLACGGIMLGSRNQRIDMPELKVPLAHDKDGLIVSPTDAQKSNSYYCPNCGDSLILRKGEKKVTHFAHKVTDKCSYETIIHKLAKQRIAEVINSYIETKNEPPVIKRLCHVCNWLTRQKLPDRITSVSTEKKLKSGFVADVAMACPPKTSPGKMLESGLSGKGAF